MSFYVTAVVIGLYNARNMMGRPAVRFHIPIDIGVPRGRFARFRAENAPPGIIYIDEGLTADPMGNGLDGSSIAIMPVGVAAELAKAYMERDPELIKMLNVWFGPSIAVAYSSKM